MKARYGADSKTESMVQILEKVSDLILWEPISIFVGHIVAKFLSPKSMKIMIWL